MNNQELRQPIPITRSSDVDKIATAICAQLDAALVSQAFTRQQLVYNPGVRFEVVDLAVRQWATLHAGAIEERGGAYGVFVDGREVVAVLRPEQRHEADIAGMWRPTDRGGL